MGELLSYTREDLMKIFQRAGISLYHVKSFLKAVYRENQLDPFISELLPSSVKSLAANTSLFQPKLVTLEHSEDDSSLKFLLKLKDGKEVETVLIPEKNRLTLCLSSQVGCRQKCVFCFTGKMGLLRNLRTEEIVSQVTFVNRWLFENPLWLLENNYNKSLRITNIVFMGMGEPLDNIESLIPAVSLLKEPWGLNIAPRRITVSTAGHGEGLKSFIESNPNVSLALSLHSAKNSLRSKIMPINRSYPLADVLSMMEDYTKKNNREIFIQYTLFSKVNDSEEDALALAELLKDKKIKVNLIPFNEVDFSALKRPSNEVVKDFQTILIKEGIRTTVRFSKGRDIQAACGQLNREQDS